MVDRNILFGLNVNRSFSDIVDRDEAIENLGVKIADLDVIRNSAEAGVTRNDIRALSGLNFPLERYIQKLRSDSQQYNGIIDTTAGTKEQLRGGLTVNGVLAASSIKYNYLEDGTNLVKSADISTSRVSSWSSTDTTPTDFSPIFYGGDVEVGGTLTTNNLNIISPPETVRFRNSEVPTHLVQATINGSTVYFYAMKGIPLNFEGFFRNVDSRFELVTPGALSIRVVNLQNDVYTKEYENLGGLSATTPTLIYRDTSAAPKRIEIYHDPNNIKTISLSQIGLEQLPNAELEGLQNLTLYRNSLREFPDLTVFAPNLTYIDLRENNFTLADDPNLRKFNQNVVDRLPTTLTDLLLGNTFDGSITGDLRNRFTNLRNFNITSHSRGGARQVFTADEDDPNATLPEVPDTVTSYSASYNGFRTLPQSIKELPNLVNFNVYGNDITDTNFYLTSNDIYEVDTGGSNQISVADMTNKSNLYRYTSQNQYSGAPGNMLVNADGTYKFKNCGNLDRLYFYNSRYNGPIPKLEGNPKLNYCEFRYTNLSGGKSSTERDFVLYPDIFDDCAESIRTFRLSSYALINAPIASDVFSKTVNMQGIEIRSFNRGVTGNIPDLSRMTNLRYLVMLQNKLEGNLPTFAGNPRLYYVHLYSNRLSGAIPQIESTGLLYLYIHYNQFTAFTGLETPNLRRLFISVNQITGAIPYLGNLTRMYDCYMNNNQFDSYTVGSLIDCTAISRLDVSNNPNLSESDVNAIVHDMYLNYEKKPRSGVSVNIRNTAIPTGDAVEEIEFLRNKGWNIRT